MTSADTGKNLPFVAVTLRTRRIDEATLRGTLFLTNKSNKVAAPIATKKSEIDWVVDVFVLRYHPPGDERFLEPSSQHCTRQAVSITPRDNSHDS